MRVSGGLCVYGFDGKIRIQTFPRRFISWTIVRRAASICRAVTQPGSKACKPYSPKLTSAPRRALPLIRPRICLRHFTRFGINIITTSSKATHYAYAAIRSRIRLQLPPPFLQFQGQLRLCKPRLSHPADHRLCWLPSWRNPDSRAAFVEERVHHATSRHGTFPRHPSDHPP